MKLQANRLGRALLGAFFVLIATRGLAQDVPNAPTGAIEQTYYAAGPHAVTFDADAGCCDRSDYGYVAWYPSTAGSDGQRYPVISWGNGTGAQPENYAYLLSHWASWGFIVIATRQPNTGTGGEILDAIDFLAAADADPNSPFHAAVDLDRVGVAGHSQGATGTVNALRLGDGAVRTGIPMEIPSQIWCSDAISCTDASQLEQGSVFFLAGSADVLISPPEQTLPWRIVGQQSNRGYYDATPRRLSKLMATLLGPDHNDVQGQPDCAQAAVPCVNGVYGYLGYTTAWFMAELLDDATARSAFVRDTGEIFLQDSNWANQVSNIRR